MIIHCLYVIILVSLDLYIVLSLLGFPSSFPKVRILSINYPCLSFSWFLQDLYIVLYLLWASS